MIEWENGEITSESLTIIAADDPVTFAIYTQEHGLDLDGGCALKVLQGVTRSSFAWSTKPNSGPIALLCTTNMITKSQEIMTMLSNLISTMAIPSGKLLLPLR